MTTPIRSPVAVRVGQMMTGLGVGCGVGIGVGYPIALGSIPVLGDLVTATSSAGSRAFGGVGRQVFRLLGKSGIRSLKAGAGCGVGIGHGFGVGIALKPGVSRQILHSFQERLLAVGNKLRRYLPASEGETSEPTKDKHPKFLIETASKVPSTGIRNIEMSPKAWNSSHGEIGRTLDVEPALSTSSSSRREVHDLEQQNDILRALLRHQELIEELRVQNATILQVLSEQLDVRVLGKEADANKVVEDASHSKLSRKKEMLHAMHSRTHYPDHACFDCKTYSRRRR